VTNASDAPITKLLNDVENGRAGARDALLAVVYDELHRMAQAKMAGLPPGQTLQPTALVHDAYAKLFPLQSPSWQDRGQFFRAAARAMRNIIVDHARHDARLKRGGGLVRIAIDEISAATSTAPEAIVALNEAVERLDARRRELVELRFFAGLTMEETATTLDVPLRTLEREWRYVRARLRKDLSDFGDPSV
jgi:RNA polymerase sigma factor (TIGR02999 family)